MENMSEAGGSGEIPQAAAGLQLLVELPSWPGEFFGNLRDLFVPRRLPQLQLQSVPAEFWADVFVPRRLPWKRFIESGACHAIAIGLLIAATRFFALQPRVVARPVFDHAQVIYYKASDYLPPLDTRSEQSAQARKADPEFARQAIISVPREADNRSQTLVAPPSVRLKRDVAMPNIVAWSDKVEKPRLAIPPVPLTPAAEITRIAPALQAAVVSPPPDASRLTHRQNAPSLQGAVVAPPPEIRAANVGGMRSPELAVVAPPPTVENAWARPIGDLNIGRSSVIAPAPQLPVTEQRARGGSRGFGGGPQVVAPPPSVSAAGSSGGSFGARGRVIALNLHPAVGAPPDPAPGNRRGAFAATPEGHSGASGSAGASGSGKNENGGESRGKEGSDMPAGLYVGSTTAKTAAVAGDSGKASANSVSPNLVASMRPSRVTAPSRAMQPDSAASLSEPERAVFGDRKFYSVTLNMPNLNSASGSWVIRFAERDHESGDRDSQNHDSNNHDLNNPDSNKRDGSASAQDLSQPMATRKVDPAYPLQLMRQNVAGTVILYAIIRADGSVGNVRVLRGVDERLDQFASQALAQWQFQPATKNGAPVDVEATFKIPFRPTRVGKDF
jgi:TonB family protein